MVISPFLNTFRVQKFASAREVKEVLKRDIDVIVVTRYSEPRKVSDVKEHEKYREALEEAGIKAITVR